MEFGQTRGTQFSFLCSHVSGFNSGGFDFCDGIALMTPLTGQLVACSLLTSRFRLEPRQPESLKHRAESSLYIFKTIFIPTKLTPCIHSRSHLHIYNSCTRS